MSDEEEIIGNDFDRVLRAAMMGAGQVAETIKRHGQERDRQAADRAAQVAREQNEITRRIHDQVNREPFWRSADGERVANAATYGATLANVDPRARDIYEVVRERSHELYGIDVDRLRARFPDSEEQRRNALMNAVDDYLAAKRADIEAGSDREQSADLSSQADDEREAGDPHAEATEEAAQESAHDAVEHAEDHDRLQSRGGAEETAAGVHGQEAQQTRESAQAAAREPSTKAGVARQQAASSYPQGASKTLTQSRNTKQPKARGNRAADQVRERSKTLSR